MLTGRKYRLALTPEQAEWCEAFGGICRSVWNTALERRRECRRRGVWMNYHEQAGQLADVKCEHPWLKQAPSHVLQQALRDLDRACRERGTFRVWWRSARRWSSSFRFPAGKQIIVDRLGRKWGRAKLPKLGWVRFRWSRAGAHWYVSFLVEDGATTPQQHAAPHSGVGVDRGVAAAVATSDGDLVDREFRTPGETRRYRRCQQKLARQRRGSANRKKTLAAMRRIKRRETDRRDDFCAQTAHRLVTRHALVAVEYLRTQNMTRSARGTVDTPGRNVRAKAGLNRSILDKGWHKLQLALESVARYTGTQIVKVPAAYTSQTCSACRAVDPKSRESQAVFRCTRCGHAEHADVNAAKNVLAAGQAVTACGDLAVGRSAKQEPAEDREVTPHQPALELVGIPPALTVGRTSSTLSKIIGESTTRSSTRLPLA